MVYFCDNEVYSDSEESLCEENSNVDKEIKESDKWDNYLDLFFHIRDKYNNFYFFKDIRAYEIYELDIEKYQGYNPLINKINKNDRYWVIKLMEAVGCLDYEQMTESMIYDFYQKIENLNSFKEKKKGTFKTWKVF